MDSLQKKSAPEVKNGIRWEVFLPAYLVIAAAAAVGIFNKEALHWPASSSEESSCL